MKSKRRKKAISPNTTLADMTPASMRAQKGPKKVIGSSASQDTQHVTEEHARQAAWVLSLAGVPTVLNKRRFEIEMMFSGGGYEGTTMFAESLTEAIDKAIESRSKYSVVGIARVKELLSDGDRGFQLLSSERLS